MEEPSKLPVGEMNPGYPEEMQILLTTQSGWVKADPTVRLESAGLEQPDQPTDRSVRVGQPLSGITATMQ